MKKNSFFLILGLLFITACGQAATIPEENTATEEISGDLGIAINSAWSRSTPELMDGSGIAYMKITNTGSRAETLLAGKTPIAEGVELHMHVMDANGVLRMRMVDGGRIEIPAGETVELKPGDLHVMLVNIDNGLDAGNTFPLTLKFEHAGEITILVPIADREPKEDTVMELFAGGYETLEQ